MNHVTKIAILSLAFALISACGGGGSTSTPTPSGGGSLSAAVLNALPVANVGQDQSVIAGSTVTIDGGASSDANGDALTFKWVLVSNPGGSAAALASPSSVRPVFVTDLVGVYVASLTVNDGKADSASVSTIITALAKATSANTAPVANAGSNQNVPVGTTVTLNGSASSDANSNSLTYKWTLITKPVGTVAGITPAGAISVNPLFVVDTVGTYVASLIVNDGIVDSAPVAVFITAIAAPSSANMPPIANAGTDQNVTNGATVSLNGALSTDPNGDHLTYLWSFAAKPLTSNTSISTPTSENAQFIADVPGTYDVKLMVNDGKVNSTVGDIISIVATPASIAIIADTGVYRCATLTKDQALALYAQGHAYLDRDHDGKPCEANDILNELAAYVAPISSSSGQCYVNGYYRKSGTYVHGYYRSCGT